MKNFAAYLSQRPVPSEFTLRTFEKPDGKLAFTIEGGEEPMDFEVYQNIALPLRGETPKV